MNIEKVIKYKDELQFNLTFEEISKTYREILYDYYETFEDYQKIHCYQLLRDTIAIFTQMVNGREFEEDYLKDKIKW